MGTFGGMSPYPRRLGGGRKRTQLILDALNADCGTAFLAADKTTAVYVENLAVARAIAAAWSTNARLGNSWVPSRMSVDILQRWETILGLTPSPTDTMPARRARVALLFSRVGQTSNIGYLYTLLTNALGGAFVALEHVDYSTAAITVPDGTYPWGTTSTVAPWSSTVAHIMVRLQKPAGWTESDFVAAAAKVFPLLEPVVPAWVTFDWYRGGPTAAPLSGGASAAGFFLDDPINLDNEVFSS